jgi:hypothetical protein
MIAVRSLRRHYTGNLVVFLNRADDHDEFVAKDLVSEGADIAYYEAPPLRNPKLKATYKMRVAKCTPFDTTLFFDSDVLFQASPEVVFKLCAGTGLGVTECGGHPRKGRTVQTSNVAAQRDPEGKVPAEIRAGTNSGLPRINHGLFLISKAHPFFEAWPRFHQDYGWFESDEESITQYHLPLYPHTYVDQTFNRASHLTGPAEINSAAMIHYLISRHVGPSMSRGHTLAIDKWIAAFTDLRLSRSPTGLEYYFAMDPRVGKTGVNVFPETKR